MKKPEAPFYLAMKQKRRADDQFATGQVFVGRSFCCWPPRKVKLSNHSARNTSNGRLFDANFPENYVHQHPMSDALSRRNQPATSSCTHINLDDSVKVPSASNIQNAVTSVSSSYPSTSNALEAIFAGTNISSVSDWAGQYRQRSSFKATKKALH